MDSDAIALTIEERAVLSEILAPFADRIEHVGIFGSRVLGRARPASDIDLVLYGDLDDRVVARIWSLFDQSNLAVTVDIASYKALGQSAFRRHIDRYAQTLFTREDLLAVRKGRQPA